MIRAWSPRQRLQRLRDLYARHRHHAALLKICALLVLTAACGPAADGPSTSPEGLAQDSATSNIDAAANDDWTGSDHGSDAPDDDAPIVLDDPACVVTPGYDPQADEWNFEFQMKYFRLSVIHESSGRQWAQEYNLLDFQIDYAGLTWPAPGVLSEGLRKYNVKYGPWVFYAGLTLGSPCSVDADCRPIAVRMSERRLLDVDELSPHWETPKQMAMVRCLAVGPHMSTVCAVPCESDDHCADFEDPVRAAKHRAPSAGTGQACVLGSDHGSCVNDFATTLRCTRHAVRHHRAGPCGRSHPSYGTCPGTLRCLLEGQPPHCDAPEPSADGCQGHTPPPPPPAPCDAPPKALDGYFDDLGPCDTWPDSQPPCDLSGQPCSPGQLCVPLRMGRRCLDVSKAYWGSTPKGGCWPHTPSSAQAGGDWVVLPGTLPNAFTPTDALEAYDVRLDWQAARGVPCRDDADCKLPVTSPFGKTVWLQGATRCAEETPGAGGTCLKPCDIPTHGLCHEGTACGQGPGGWRWCKPVEQTPTCSVLAAQLWTEFGAGQRPCSKANLFGVCVGKAVCTNAGAPPVCDASEPKPEICGDGVDQDCDGATDEGCSP